MSSSPQPQRLQPGDAPGPAASPGPATSPGPGAWNPFRYPEVPRSSAQAGASVDKERERMAAEETQRLAAMQEGEAKARGWYEEELRRERDAMRLALDEFGRQRQSYFLNLEREAVRLALAIARKVLERETRVDPLAVAAMVHVALESLQANTSVTLRVHPAAAQDWRLYFATRESAMREKAAPAEAVPAIVEDGTLAEGNCVVVTAMGTADISLEKKILEIETNFLELLAQRPGASK